jgi:hypothetical protein
MMNCPSEIADILLEIIEYGILRARATADRKQAVLELDHIHNLPALIRNYSEDALGYYWSVEKPTIVEHCGPSEVSIFEPLWALLEPHVAVMEESARRG